MLDPEKRRLLLRPWSALAPAPDARSAMAGAIDNFVGATAELGRCAGRFERPATRYRLGAAADSVADIVHGDPYRGHALIVDEYPRALPPPGGPGTDRQRQACAR